MLSNDDVRYNKNHSRLGIIVEHTICKIKKLGVMGTKFRNRLRRYNNISDIISGLLNFRVCSLTGYQPKNTVKVVESIDHNC